MILKLDMERPRTVGDIRAFMAGSEPVDFEFTDRRDACRGVRSSAVIQPTPGHERIGSEAMTATSRCRVYVAVNVQRLWRACNYLVFKDKSKEFPACTLLSKFTQ